eukprot:9284731-Prorocentrum_lima.AAC.1
MTTSGGWAAVPGGAVGCARSSSSCRVLGASSMAVRPRILASCRAACPPGSAPCTPLACPRSQPRH